MPCQWRKDKKSKGMVMGVEVVTAGDLFETSTKKMCEGVRAHFIAESRLEEHDRVRRHPETCESRVFSLSEADERWQNRQEPPSLLGNMGMCIYSLGPAAWETDMVFMTDDSSYGWKILKQAGWSAMSFRFRGTAHKEFSTWREHIDHFYGSGVKVIESVEELLSQLNGELETVPS